jgi:hypothetical protein
MSALCTKRTQASALHMSAFGGKADIAPASQMSAYDPKRTSCGHAGAPTCVRFGLGAMSKKDHVSSINNCANT